MTKKHQYQQVHNIIIIRIKIKIIKLAPHSLATQNQNHRINPYTHLWEKERERERWVTTFLVLLLPVPPLPHGGGAAMVSSAMVHLDPSLYPSPFNPHSHGSSCHLCHRRMIKSPLLWWLWRRSETRGWRPAPFYTAQAQWLQNSHWPYCIQRQPGTSLYLQGQLNKFLGLRRKF